MALLHGLARAGGRIFVGRVALAMQSPLTMDIHSSRDAIRTGNWINLVIGVWLVISAFVWPHVGAALANTVIVGLMIAVLAGAAFWRPAASAVIALPGAWLVLSAIFIHHGHSVTPLHNAVLGGIAILAATTPIVATDDHLTRPAH